MAVRTGRRAQAHWLNGGWRSRGFDIDGDPLPWVHSKTLRDIREDMASSPPHVDVVEVQKYDKRAETYVPAGQLVRLRVTQRRHDHRTIIRHQRTPA